jgi:hypothetical protein
MHKQPAQLTPQALLVPGPSVMAVNGVLKAYPLPSTVAIEV